MDMFSKLPLCIIETILCYLNTKEVVRTSILSRDWRYRWINIPKLEFIEVTTQVVTTEAELPERRKLFGVFYQVLLMHEGPINEFTLSINTNNRVYVEIDRILFHLSGKNTVKKLRLCFNYCYKLPISFFSFRHLTDLCVKGCDLDDQPTFDIYSSLTSLSLEDVYISNKTLLRLVSNCPLIKTLVVIGCTILSKETCDGFDSKDNPSIISLFEYLPVIESLSTSHDLLECFVHNRELRELPSALMHLKYLCIDNVYKDIKDVSPNLNLLIRSAPNLEKLKILEHPVCQRDVMYSSSLEDYSDMWLEHLKELEITIFSSEESGLDFVKLVLAKSPRLGKVGIRLHKIASTADQEYGKAKLLRLSEIFKGFRSASLKAYIDLELVVRIIETVTDCEAVCFHGLSLLL